MAAERMEAELFGRVARDYVRADGEWVEAEDVSDGSNSP